MVPPKIGGPHEVSLVHIRADSAPETRPTHAEHRAEPTGTHDVGPHRAPLEPSFRDATWQSFYKGDDAHRANMLIAARHELNGIIKIDNLHRLTPAQVEQALSRKPRSERLAIKIAVDAFRRKYIQLNSEPVDPSAMALLFGNLVPSHRAFGEARRALNARLEVMENALAGLEPAGKRLVDSAAEKEAKEAQRAAENALAARAHTPEHDDKHAAALATSDAHASAMLSMQAQLDAANARASKADADHKGAQEQLATAQSANATLQAFADETVAANKTLVARLDEAEAAAVKSNADNLAATQALGAAHARTAELEQSNLELRAQLNSQDKQIAAQAAQIGEQTAALGDERTRQEAATAKASAAQQDFDHARAKYEGDAAQNVEALHAAQQQIDLLSASNRGATPELERRDARIAEQAQRISVLTGESAATRSALIAANDTHAHQLTTAKLSAQQAEDRARKAEARSVRLMHDVEAAQTETNGLANRVQELQGERSQLQTDLERITTENQHLASALKKSQAEFDAFRQTVPDAQQATEALFTAAKENQALLASNKKAAAAAKQRIDELDSALKATTQSNNDLDARATDLLDQRDKAQDAAKAMQAAHRKDLDALRAQLETVTSTVAEANRRSEKSVAHAESAVKAREAASARIEELEVQQKESVALLQTQLADHSAQQGKTKSHQAALASAVESVESHVTNAVNARVRLEQAQNNLAYANAALEEEQESQAFRQQRTELARKYGAAIGAPPAPDAIKKLEEAVTKAQVDLEQAQAASVAATNASVAALQSHLTSQGNALNEAQARYDRLAQGAAESVARLSPPAEEPAPSPHAEAASAARDVAHEPAADEQSPDEVHYGAFQQRRLLSRSMGP